MYRGKLISVTLMECFFLFFFVGWENGLVALPLSSGIHSPKISLHLIKLMASGMMLFCRIGFACKAHLV